MIDFMHRSAERELMDDPLLADKDLREALQDISKVNKWLGGDRITSHAVSSILKKHPSKTHWTIADIGCGDGEMLRILSKKFENFGPTFSFTGIDISEQSLEMARSSSKDFKNILFKNENILTAKTDEVYDITLCTLTLHHIPEEQLISFVKGMIQRTKYDIIINDLQRSKMAYHLFTLISRIFIKSPIAKNDGLVSIASAFKRNDLEKYAQVLGLHQHSISWKWAFRYLWHIKII